VGYEAGLNSTGRQNVFLGAGAGRAFTSGADNTLIGSGAGGSNDSPFVEATGSKNVFVGYYTGYKCGSAAHNVIVGAESPFVSNLITGSYNVYLGENAGNNSGAASNNIFIGYQAGIEETASNKLIIENNYDGTDNVNKALIYGDFGLNYLIINGLLETRQNFRIINNVGSGITPEYYIYQGQAMSNGSSKQYAVGIYDPLWVAGDVWADAYHTNSDIRLKRDVRHINGALGMVLGMQGVYYKWKRDHNSGNEEESYDLSLRDQEQVGFIAQDVEKVLPQVVTTDQGGYKSVDYSKITAVLVEAIKEQQKQIEELKREVEVLKAQNR
jgi:hypothetical protein